MSILPGSVGDSTGSGVNTPDVLWTNIQDSEFYKNDAPMSRAVTRNYWTKRVAWESNPNRELRDAPIAPITAESGIFDALVASLFSGAAFAGGNMDFDFLDLGGSTMDAVEAGSEYLDVEDAVSVIDAVETGGSWADVASDIAVSEGAGARSGFMDWATNLGQKAVEQFIKQEIQEEFSSPASTRTTPTVRYANTPQSNIGPAGGLMSFLYPSASRVPGSTQGAYVGGGFTSGGTARSAAGGDAGGGLGFSPMIVMAMLAIVSLFAFVLLRR